MTGNEYRDRIAAYVHDNFGRCGLVVYTEVELGKTIIGKRRQLDVFIRKRGDRLALGLECKFQSSTGTTDEKIPYALADLEAMWIPGCLVYAGQGWSSGILHTLEGSRNAVFCDPPERGIRDPNRTIELDYVLASVFGFWELVIPDQRIFEPERASLGLGLRRISEAAAASRGPASR
ncbi:MAG TPA: PD-(D/E)XK nuclease superfamily protein [Enhygromyxa sp.]|nr:PD-(D/E)XK nuclease superfamily protein [Enhygromyxa sp.]